MKMKKILIVLTFFMIFVVSLICGFLINSYINFSKHDSENTAILAEYDENNRNDMGFLNQADNKIAQTNSYNVTVSPNAEVIKTQKYSKCGHVISKREIVPREIVNLNEDKVREYYDGWKINKFSANEIDIYKECSGICDEHYILRESDGYISISSKNNIGEYIFKGLTDISVQYLPEEDRENLEHGIEIIGRENLNKFLEDYE